MNDIPVNHPTKKLRRRFPSRLAKRTGVTNNELTVGVLHVVAINLLLGVKNHAEK